MAKQWSGSRTPNSRSQKSRTISQEAKALLQPDRIPDGNQSTPPERKRRKPPILPELPDQKKSNAGSPATSTAQPAGQKLIFRPNPGPQTDFLASSEQEVLYGGAAGGGKSFALLADPVRYFGYPNANMLLIRRTTEELRELIQKSKELYLGYDSRMKWSERDKTWTAPSGAKLWMSYLDRDDDVTRYQGQAFTWIGFDELTQWPTPYAWEYLRSRLRTHDPALKKFLSQRATTNPGGVGHNWVKKMFIDPSPPNKPFWATDIETGEVLRFPKGHSSGKGGQPLLRRKFVPATLHDNPYLADDGMYEANLLSLPENQRKRLLEGDWDLQEGAAFPDFDRKVHVVEPFEIPYHWRKFRAADYGYSSRTGVLWFAIAPNGQLVVYRELYVSKVTAADLAPMIKDLEREEKIAYGVLDSSLWHKRGDTGPSLAEQMIIRGCHWRPADRSAGSRIAGKNEIHRRLKVDEFTGEPGIVFFDTCTNLLAQLPVIPLDKKNPEDVDTKSEDHLYDALRYGVMTRPRSSAFELAPPPKPAAVDPVFGY